MKRIAGVHFSERKIEIAAPRNNSIELVTLAFKKPLLFSDDKAVSWRLLTLKKELEAIVGKTKYEAVLAVPSNLGIREFYRTERLCKHAGMNVIRLVSELSSAALFFGQQRIKHKGLVCAFRYADKANLTAGVFNDELGVCETVYEGKWKAAPLEKMLYEANIGVYRRSEIARYLCIGDVNEKTHFITEVLKGKGKKKVIKAIGYPALGALVQGAILSGRIKDNLLIPEFPWLPYVRSHLHREVWICRKCGIKGAKEAKKCPRCRGRLEKEAAPIFGQKSKGFRYLFPIVMGRTSIPFRVKKMLYLKAGVKAIELNIINPEGGDAKPLMLSMHSTRGRFHGLCELTMDIHSNWRCLIRLASVSNKKMHKEFDLGPLLSRPLNLEMAGVVQERYKKARTIIPLPSPELASDYEPPSKPMSDEEWDQLVLALDAERLENVKRKEKRRWSGILSNEEVDALLKGVSDS